MKTINRAILLFLFIIALSACSSAPENNMPEQTPPAGNAKVSLSALCAEKNGNWLAEYSECEGVDPDFCRTYGGNFNECASACRHDPKAEVCTMQCVPVCSYAEVGPKPADVPNTK